MTDPSAGAGAGRAVLSYAALDDHALACNASAAGCAPLFLRAGELGPQMEHWLLAQQGVVPWPPANALVEAAGGAVPNRLREMDDGCALLRLAADPLPGTELTKLSIRAKRAASRAGFGERVSGQLAAALEEMLANIIEHSGVAGSGVVAFRGSPGQFEFVAGDQGVGALGSLRTNPQYAAVQAARDALPLILQDGCTCTGDPDRGTGFSDLFRGLANHRGRLRFRSGDAAVIIDGQSPTAIRPKVKARAPVRGFIASVCCLPA